MARMGLPEVTLTRVLCVAAHPDDLDFAVSGTVAGFVEAGMDVTYLLCTRGEQGGFDETPREEMPVIREREQRAAADALGVKDVRFLDGYRDGWLEPTPELQREITQVIRQVRPHRILTSSPTGTGTASRPATPTIWRRVRPPSGPSTRRHATRSRSRSSSPRDWNRGPSASCGCGGIPLPRTPSTSPTGSTASWRRSASTPARRPTRRTWSSGSGNAARRRRRRTACRAGDSRRRSGWSPPAESDQPDRTSRPGGPVGAHRTTCRHRRDGPSAGPTGRPLS